MEQARRPLGGSREVERPERVVGDAESRPLRATHRTRAVGGRGVPQVAQGRARGEAAWVWVSSRPVRSSAFTECVYARIKIYAALDV